MSNCMSLKRRAPVFPELSKSTTASDCCLLPRPRKRSRVVESIFSGLTSDDWLELESDLSDDFDNQDRLPSLEVKKDCIPNNITMSLTSALSEMIHACTEEDEELRSSEKSPPSSSDDRSLIILTDANDTNDVSRTDTSPEKIPATPNTGTKQGGLEAKLLTLTSFPFRVFSADDNFFRLTGLTSSRVIGEPLLTLFANKKPQLNPHAVDTPLDVFDGTLVTVSNDGIPATSGTFTRTMKVEPVWTRSEELKIAQVSHYKVTLQ